MEAPGYQLRVREHPSYLAEVTGFIRDGQVLDITQEKGIWVRLANSTVDDLKETASFSDAKEYWTARVTGDGVMLKKLIDQPHDVASAEVTSAHGSRCLPGRATEHFIEAFEDASYVVSVSLGIPPNLALGH
eukprot:gene7803-9270_t